MAHGVCRGSKLEQHAEAHAERHGAGAGGAPQRCSRAAWSEDGFRPMIPLSDAMMTTQSANAHGCVEARPH